MCTKTIRPFSCEIVKSESHCKSFKVFYCKRISFLFYLEEIHAREIVMISQSHSTVRTSFGNEDNFLKSVFNCKETIVFW